MSTPGENDPVESLSDIRVQVSENESDSDETLSELQTRLQKLEKKKRLSAEKAKKKKLKARIAELEKEFAEKVPVVEAEDPKIEDLRQKPDLQQAVRARMRQLGLNPSDSTDSDVETGHSRGYSSKPEFDLQVLKDGLRFSRKAAFSEGTWANLETQWSSFLLFCDYFKFDLFPPEAECLSLFAQFLSRSFKSAQAIRNYVSGVQTMYRFLGCRIPEKPWVLNMTFKGLSRLMRHKPLQALPITPKILLEFFTFFRHVKSF